MRAGSLSENDQRDKSPAERKSQRGHVGDRHRIARERDTNGGREPHALAVLGREQQRE